MMQRSSLARDPSKINPFQALKTDDLASLQEWIDDVKRRCVSSEEVALLVNKLRDGTNQSTLLHWACYLGSEEAAALLLANGASVDALEADGKTALHWAAFEGHFALTELLLKHHADCWICDTLKRTPCHCALSQGHTEIAQSLPNYAEVIAHKERKIPDFLNCGTPSHIVAASENVPETEFEVEQRQRATGLFLEKVKQESVSRNKRSPAESEKREHTESPDPIGPRGTEAEIPRSQLPKPIPETKEPQEQAFRVESADEGDMSLTESKQRKHEERQKRREDRQRRREEREARRAQRWKEWVEELVRLAAHYDPSFHAVQPNERVCGGEAATHQSTFIRWAPSDGETVRPTSRHRERCQSRVAIPSTRFPPDLLPYEPRVPSRCRSSSSKHTREVRMWRPPSSARVEPIADICTRPSAFRPHE